MKTNRLVIAIAFLGILLLAGRVLVDSDTWWHLRAGQWIVEHHSILSVDQFSFSRAGQTWHYPGWLAEVLMLGAYSLGGISGVNLLFLLILLASIILIFLTMEGDSYLRSFTLILAAGAATIYWSARPQLFSFLFAAVFYLCIREFLFGKRNLLFLLPPIMVLWVNLHGGFAIGFFFLILGLAGQSFFYTFHPDGRKSGESRKIIWLSIAGASCLLAALINPYGTEMLIYPFKTVSIQTLQNYLQEWQSPDFHNLHAQMFLWLLFITWGMIGFSPRRLDVRDFLFLAATSYIGFLAWRNTVFLSIVAPAMITIYGGAILQKVFPGWNPTAGTSRMMRVVNAIILLILCGVSVIRISLSISGDAIQKEIDRQMPVDAVDYLERNPDLGRIFNSYNWGSYLLWRLPSYPVFVDGRTDLFDDEILDQYLIAVQGQPGWQEVLEQWDIQVVLIEPTVPLSQLLILDGWHMRYQDSQAVIMQKPAP